MFCDGRREMLIPAGSRLEVTRCVDRSSTAGRCAIHHFRLVRRIPVPVTGWRGNNGAPKVLTGRIESLGASISVATAEFVAAFTVLTGETGTGARPWW